MEKDRREEDSEYKIKIAVLEERLNGSKEALILQAKVYEERLESLNNTRALTTEEIKSIQAKYLLRETYDVHHEQFDKRITMLESSKIRQNVTMSLGMGIFTILIGLLIYHIFQFK